MPHTGLKHPLRLQLKIAVEEILTDIFGSIPYRDESWTGRQARNQEIIQRLKAGESVEDLARAYGVTPQRIYQIRS